MYEDKPVRKDGESDNDYSNRKGKWEARVNEERKSQREQEQGASLSPLEKFKRVWGG